MLNEVEIIKKTLQCDIIGNAQQIQELWSGYGQLKRYRINNSAIKSIIVKHIKLPQISKHPKGWNTSLSHKRKTDSYKIEKNWYSYYSHKARIACKLPTYFYSEKSEEELLLIIEDLDQAGYSIRHNMKTVHLEDIKACLNWFANFHARFINHSADRLWEIGSYWHLETRPEEWKQMNHPELKQHADLIHHKLKNARYQTIIHGDAKLANFCFSSTHQVAAVDFQYVGRGCGIKDVAYFLSSCLSSTLCFSYEKELLQFYFSALDESLPNSIDKKALIKEWRSLYSLAWADFHRFLDGWSPEHWKLHEYTKTQTKKVLSTIGK